VAREKQLVTYKGIPIILSADFFSRNFASQNGVAQYIQSAERKNHQPRISGKAVLQN